MNTKLSIASVLSLGLLMAAGPALSCDGMGPNVHMGNIVSIDRANGFLVILDAQSQQPIRFIVSDHSLGSLQVDDAVKVNYEETRDGTLRSLELTRL